MVLHGRSNVNPSLKPNTRSIALISIDPKASKTKCTVASDNAEQK